MSPAVLAAFGLLLGPLIGIVVDRAAERVPPRPEHRCPTCQIGLGPRSLVPVLSWFVACPKGHGRSWRYPLVDLGLAASFALMGWRFGDDWHLWPYLALTAALVAMSAIDFETYLLPDVLTIPTLAFGLVAVAIAAFTDLGGPYAVPALVGMAFYGIFVFVAFIINPAGIGFGDVKLAPLLGLMVGWAVVSSLEGIRLTTYAIILGFLGGAVIGTIANLALRRGLRAEIPFGPAMVAGTLLIVLLTPQLTSA